MRGKAIAIQERAYWMARHEAGESFRALSVASGIRREVLSRWWQRYTAAGLPGLEPRSRRPTRSPTAVRQAVVRAVLRQRQKARGPAVIATAVPVSVSTVYRILVRHDRNRLHVPAPREIRRYEKTRPGELVHLDVKFLPALRNARWDFEFGAVDDFTREAVAWIATEQSARTAMEFLRRVLDALPYRIEAVLTDNAWVFTMQRAFHHHRDTPFAALCREAGIRHRLVRPYRPQCNGKVERFFRTVNDECFNRRVLTTFSARVRALERFLLYYNHERPHLSLGGRTPIERREAFFAGAKV
jgi:transposase InsO family protein